MKLTVIQYADSAPPRELSALIRPPGGTIGRSSGCDLTLDDPEHRLPQVQGLLTHRHDGWYLRNASPLAPIKVNGQLLPLDQECRLLEGNHLLIGAFLIRCEANDSMSFPPHSHSEARLARNPQTTEGQGFSPATESNPFADLLSGVPLSAPSPQEAPRLHLENNTGTADTERPWVAPSYFGKLPETSASLFAPQATRFGNEPAMAQPVTDTSLDPLALFGAAPHGSELLEDIGPSLLSKPSAAGPMHLGQRELHPDIGSPSFGDSVDIGRTALRLGEFPCPPKTPPVSPRPAFFPAQESEPSFDGHRDVTLPLASTAIPLEHSAPDLSLESPPEGNGLGAAVEHPVGKAILEVFSEQPSSSEPLPATEFPFPFSDHLTSTSQASLPSGFADASALVVDAELLVLQRPAEGFPDSPEAQDTLDTGVQAQIGEHRAQSEAFREAGQVDAQTAARALESFMNAAGVEQISIAPMSLDQRMAQLGRLFRLFADGTVRLLSSRTLVKREVRAELTRVMSTANNPFKVLPSGEAVLIQMFGQHLPGFLPAEQAIGEALDDLQRHQLGMLAGTRTALLELIRQLDPAACEHEVTSNGLLDRLFPLRVQSRRWRHYRSRYHRVFMLARENDFYRLLGETFLRAYEEEISRCASPGHERDRENLA